MYADPVVRKILLCQPALNAQDAAAVSDQVRSGWIGPGPRTEEFQKAIADVAGKKYCAATTSGTVALSIAAHAAGLRTGDEILVPAYGVISTINAFASFGLRPRLVDIDKATGCMSPEALQLRLTKNTKAVCYVDFSGATGQSLLEIQAFCRKKKIILIEDAACAMGQTFQGKQAGAFGDIGIYSFSVPKIVTTGQGGAIVTDHEAFWNAALCFMDQGDREWRKTNLNHGIGNNLRFTDVLAALGLSQMKRLPQLLDQKRKIFKIFEKGLNEKIYHLEGGGAPLHHIIFSAAAERMVHVLSGRGIQAVRQYRTLSEHPAYKELADISFPHADYWTRYAVYLPFGLELTEGDAERIVKAVLDSGIKIEAAGK